MANQAAFLISGTPSVDPATGDRQYTAVLSETLTCTLEANPSQALSATFEIFDPNDSESPFASKAAPLRTWNENSLPAITVGTVPFGINDSVTIDMPAAVAPPSPNIHSYVIRCTASTPGDGSPGSQTQVFERQVLIFGLITTPVIRKTVPGESTQARARAWSDSINDLVDAMENLTAGSAPSQLVSAAGQFTVPTAVAVGDLVYVTGTDAADRADNAAIGTMPAVALVIAKPTTTTATLAFAGVVGGLSGMTSGVMQFVGLLGARIEAGALPSAPGSVIQQVGVAESATSLIFQPRPAVVL